MIANSSSPSGTIPISIQLACALWLKSVFAFAACTAIAQESYEPTRFEKSVVALGWIQPMEMAIAPDGLIYVIELGGEIKTFDPTTALVRSIGKIDVTTQQENGLIGMALDPEFAINRWMFLQYSPIEFSGQYIRRFTVNGDGLIDMQSEVAIMQFEEQRQECCHHAGSMEFGPDGCLYIGTGDNTNPFGDSQGFAPIDEREARGAFNGLRTASNTKSHNGKVLRIRPLPEGGYAIPDGNLFPPDGSIGLPEIYVMGCRNPWRLNVDRRTGYLYWGDVGPDAGGDNERGPRGYDEVNQARAAGNFGWPLFIGKNRPYLKVDFSDGSIGDPFDPMKPINFSRFNTGAKELPPAQPAWIYYPAGDSQEFPAVGSGGRTACAGPVYYFDPASPSTVKFPQAFDRTLFIFEWSRNWIIAVHLDEQSNIAHMERFLPNETFVRPIDMQFDANGALYVIEYGETWGVNPDAKLVRIDYQSGNRAPRAKIADTHRSGREPLTVRLSASESSDKDGDPMEFAWLAIESSDSSIRIPLGNTPTIEPTFATPGVFNVQVTVTDPNGASDSAVVPVIVGNSQPQVAFLEPIDGDFYDPTQPLKFQVTVTDMEDGSSDEEVVASSDLDMLDAAAPDRVLVDAKWVAPSQTANGIEETGPLGLKLMRASDCFNCHALDRAIVGPSFLDVANKYRDIPDAKALSIQRVRQGSTGIWGKVAMLPHSQHTAEQVAAMVDWVYAAQPDPTRQTARGMTSEFSFANRPEFASSFLRLTARYQDLGRDAIPPLVGTATVELRPRLQEAESAHSIHRMSELGSHNASNGKFLGAIEHGSYFVIRDVPMKLVGAIVARVTSAGAGGDIVFHAAALDGPELGRIRVDVNGDWDGWYERSTPVTDPPERCDVYVETLNSENRGGLMNIDWIRFDR